MGTTGRTAHGPLAKILADSLPPDQPVVVFDQSGIAEALQECVRRSFRGERFLVRALVPRDYTLRVDAVAPSILSSLNTMDERRAAFDQAFSGTLHVNSRALQSVAVFSHDQLRLMQAALRLADGLVVSSEAERRRINELVQTERPTVLAKLDAPQVPLVGSSPRGERDAIVIWAPHLSGDAAYAFVAALSDVRMPLLLVSNTVPNAASPAQWIAPGRATDALCRAKLIVDASAHGCDAGRRLAEWAAPIVADVESGAHEILMNVRTYDRRRFSSIFEACMTALGLPSPTQIQHAPPPDWADEMLDGPLVTIIIPTFDRPTLLRYALESIRRQKYRAIETIVVVDGGPRLDTLAADFPEVQFMYMPDNNAVVSCNTAFEAARGEYVTFLNDDDLFFPHHVSALVTALERSGESVAHGDVLTAFLRGTDEQWLLYGLESNMSRVVERSALLVSNQIGMTSCLFRKDCLAAEEPFDATVPLYRDYALWLRLMSEHDFVHVERITSCYTIRNQGQAQQSMMRLDEGLASYKVLYERYPVPGRPAIEQLRAQTMQNVAQGSTALAAAPAMEVQPALWPPWAG